MPPRGRPRNQAPRRAFQQPQQEQPNINILARPLANLQQKLQRVNQNRIDSGSVQDRPWIANLAPYVPIEIPTNEREENYIDNMFSALENHIGNHYRDNSRSLEAISNIILRGPERGNRSVDKNTTALISLNTLAQNLQGVISSTSDSLTIRHAPVPIIETWNNDNLVAYAPVTSSILKGDQYKSSGRFKNIGTMHPVPPKIGTVFADKRTSSPNTIAQRIYNQLISDIRNQIVI